MGKFEFDLSPLDEKIKIIGKPVKNWDLEKSGRELYEILYKHLPFRILDKLKKIIIAEELAANYKINSLENLKDILEQNYGSRDGLPISVSKILSAKFYETLEEAIKIRRDSKISNGL